MTAYKINVFGIVQGVAFRHFTRIEAERLGVCGTVHNLSDGSVQIYVEGQDKVVLDFLNWCHKGPDSATVERLEYEKVEFKNHKSFQIIR